MKFHVVIAEYLPEFLDGRITRINSLEKYFSKNQVEYKIYSSGKLASHGNNIKYGWYTKKSTTPRAGFRKGLKRFPIPRLNSFRLLLKLVYRKLVIIDYQILNVFFLARELKRNLFQHEKNVIIFSMPKFSILISIFFISQCKYEELVLDFRDLPFTHKLLKGNAVSYYIVKTMIAKLSSRRNTTFWVTSTNAEAQLRAFLSNNVNVRVVPNGFERFHDRPRVIERKLQSIAYFGNIGGIRSIASTYNKLTSAYKNVDFYGLVDSVTREILGVHYKGTLSRDDVPSYAMAYDHLLVVISEAEDAECAIPGKVYEYMSFRKPIILDCPKGSAVEKMLNEIKYPYYNIETGVSNLNREMPLLDDIEAKYLRENIWQSVFRDINLNE